mmetsp:Transcript_34906/g.90616  ORF Transcript_34906/g.90616 Transcript_34906/m.90616 type:complete len:210 (-) Transcript_34906:791-1420(-)
MRNNLIIHAEVDFFAVPANLLVQLPPLLQSPFQSPLWAPAKDPLCCSRLGIKVRRSKWEGLRATDFLRVVVHDGRTIHAHDLGAETDKAVMGDPLAMHAVEDLLRCGRIAHCKGDHAPKVLCIAYVAENVSGARDGDRAPACNAVKEPLLAVLVGSVSRDVLRAEGGPGQPGLSHCLLHCHMPSVWLDGVALKVRGRVRRLVYPTRGNK